MKKICDDANFGKKVIKGLRKIVLKKYRFSILLLISLLLILAFANGVSALQIKENSSVIWDTYVRQDSANTNYGTSNNLEIREHNLQARRIYIQFDLSNYTNLTFISNAKLCLYLATDGTTSNISSYLVRSEANLETSMTWNNQPCGTAFNNNTICNITIGNEMVSTGGNSYKCINITYSTQRQVDRNSSNITITLKTPEILQLNNDVFSSREAGENTKPYLEITHCTPNWIANYTPCGMNLNASCGTYNNRTKTYYDANSCGSTKGLPADNGTCIECDYCTPAWRCTNWASCLNYWANCSTIIDDNYATCCNITGLPSDCNYLGTYETDFMKPCGEMITILSVNSEYPYADCNTTISWKLIATINGTRQDFEGMFITFANTNQTFNWTWNNVTQEYEISLLFPSETDYPFTVWENYPIGAMENITGTIKARCPYQVCFEGYYLQPKNASTKYENIHAYLTAEFEDEKFKAYWGRSPYDSTLEAYLRPLDFKGLFKTQVFHTPYSNGQGCLKLWEKNKTYAFRIIDGKMSFPQGVYSTINATKMYGTYLFLGTQEMNGTNSTYKFYFKESELHPYATLFNWLLVIGLILTFVIGVALAIYVNPIIAYYLVITFVVILAITRIALWFAVG